ncbi:MAG: methyl-accepting chemotaxis protein [Treponema sp.]|nr:methyl-accepting chemotaxis protein [Treponema sp.]
MLVQVLTAMTLLFLVAFTLIGYLVTKTLTVDGHAEAVSLAQLNAQTVDRFLSTAADTAQCMGAAIEALKAEGVSDRKVLLSLVRSNLAVHPDFLATWALFEPNAWDKGEGKGEQFVPYAWRKDGQIGTSNSDSAEDYAGEVVKDYYALPKSSGKMVLLEPYRDQTETGTYVLETSVCVPLRDAKGAFLGVCGVDLSLDGLSAMVGKLSLFASGSFMIVSPGGKIVAYRDTNKLMTSLSDLASADLVAAVTRTTGSSRSSTVEGKVFHAVEPIQVAGIDQSWALVASVPADEVSSDARRIVFLIVGVCLLTLLVVTLVLVTFSARLTAPLKAITGSFAHLASGDLSGKVGVDTRDEIGALATSYNALTSNLSALVGKIKAATGQLSVVGSELTASMGRATSSLGKMAESVELVRFSAGEESESVERTTGAVGEIVKTIETLREAIERQSAAVVESSAAVEQMVMNIRSIDRNMASFDEGFHAVVETSREGLERISEAKRKASSVAERSESLLDANKIIASIAARTNLLSMNAAIEAAHAGDAGRGFAVVADEIRKLAESASDGSQETGRELSTLKGTIAEVVSSTDNAEAAFQKILASIDGVSGIVDAVKSAIDEQSAGGAQVLEAIGQINDITQRVRTEADDMLRGNRAIGDELRRLSQASAAVSESMDSISEAAATIGEAAGRVGELTRKNEESIRLVENEAAIFRT